MKLNLVENGIFPIIYDKDGNKLSGVLDTKLECAGTIQGEGKLLGTTCLFIRTSSCNLRCAWVGVDGKGSPCDTPYSSHYAETNKIEVDDIVQLVLNNTVPQHIKHVVVSGGEPTLQTKALEELLEKLNNLGYHITIETNATIHSEKISQYTNLVSMSPKLSSSTPWQANLKETGIEFNEKWAAKHEKLRINIPVIQSYIDRSKKYLNDFQLKFVVATQHDIVEIENILNQLTGWLPSDICLMPEGTTSEFLANRSHWVMEASITRGWRFTPRLHIELFGKARAV